MWCKSCRQDVPGVTSPTDGKNACPRCGTLVGQIAGSADGAADSAAKSIFDAGLDLADFTPELLEGAAAHESRAPKYVPPREETPDFQPAKPPRGEPVRTTSLRWEAANWELNEKLRHVERVTATSRRRFDDASATAGSPHFPNQSTNSNFRALRAEAEPPAFAPPPTRPYAPPPYAPQYPSPHSPGGPPNPYAPASAPEPAPHEWNEHDAEDFDDAAYEGRTGESRPGERTALAVSWTFLGLATTAFSCGGFLIGWGAIAERTRLQEFGMPIFLAGVVALVIGVLPIVMLRSLEAERKRREADRLAASLAMRASTMSLEAERERRTLGRSATRRTAA